MDAINIPTGALLLSFVLLLVPVASSLIFRLAIIKPLAVSFSRMIIQLLLIGIFLKYLFRWNNGVLNVSWLIVMIVFAVLTTAGTSGFKRAKILLPVFLSFTLSTLLIVLYINVVVVRIDRILDARYLIVLGGMLLGNALRGNIIGISTFYSNLKKDEKHYLYLLSLGASRFECILPYMRESLRTALKPTLATMATMGIVALPGMMTGQILAGASPFVAIKYQILIMTAIFVCTNMSILLTIFMTVRVSFTPYGTLKDGIFIAE